jgi:hypothetical protein
MSFFLRSARTGPLKGHKWGGSIYDIYKLTKPPEKLSFPSTSPTSLRCVSCGCYIATESDIIESRFWEKEGKIMLVEMKFVSRSWISLVCDSLKKK